MKPTFMFKSLQVVARIWTTLMFDLKVFGAHRVPDEGGVLLISNHQSYLDPVLLGVRLRRPLSYLAKSELFTNKAFSWLIRSLGAFPVRQGAGDVGAMRETIARLQEGHALNVYPEGSRTENGQLQPIEKGVALVIRKAKVPVVPVVIQGSYDAWPKCRKIFRPHPIQVYYGQPVDFSSLDREQVIQTIDRLFHDMIAELRAGKVPMDGREH
ncbi:MAG TPA: lysophospholipid acyltransferase family protein [Tepidisphaeraceae bacterium]|nr:lysophospholipid acyltransferase family protein [Tepidisphaeraceae bacterium]